MQRENDFRILINPLYLSDTNDCGRLTLLHRSLSGVNNSSASRDPAPLISQPDPSLYVSNGVKCLCVCAVSCRQRGCSRWRTTLETASTKSHTVIKNNLKKNPLKETMFRSFLVIVGWPLIEECRYWHAQTEIAPLNHMCTIAVESQCTIVSLICFTTDPWAYT